MALSNGAYNIDLVWRLQGSRCQTAVQGTTGPSKPDCSVPKELACMELEKRREYGRGVSNPGALFDGVVPIIFEQHGCPGPCAVTFLHHILRRKVGKLEQGSHLTHGVAWMVVSRTDLLHPPGHALPNVSRMLPHRAYPRQLTTRHVSLPDPWPNTEPWQGRDSQPNPDIHPRGGSFLPMCAHEATGLGLSRACCGTCTVTTLLSPRVCVSPGSSRCALSTQTWKQRSKRHWWRRSDGFWIRVPYRNAIPIRNSFRVLGWRGPEWNVQEAGAPLST